MQDGLWIEEGDECPNDLCLGHLKLGATENCCCHLGYPPCSNCLKNEPKCNICGWKNGDEIYFVEDRIEQLEI